MALPLSVLPFWIKGLRVMLHGSFQVKLGCIHQCPHNASLHWWLQMKQLLLFRLSLQFLQYLLWLLRVYRLLHLPGSEEVRLPSHSDALAEMPSS